MSANPVKIKHIIDALMASGTIMTWLSLLVRIGGLALLLPLILAILPASDVLIWQVLSTITGLIGVVDFGLQPTFARIVAYLRSGGMIENLHNRQSKIALDLDRGLFSVANVIATQQAIYRLLLAITILPTVLIGTVALWTPIHGTSEVEQAWLSWLATIFAAHLMLLNGSNVSIMTGFDRIGQSRGIEALIGICQLSSTAIVVVTSHNLMLTVFTYSFWSLPSYLVLRIMAQTTARGAGVGQGRFKLPLFKFIWSGAWRSGLGIIMSTGVFQALSLILAQITPASEAARYLLGLRVMTAVSQISQAPFYSQLPKLSSLKGSGNGTELIRVTAKAMSSALWTYALGVLGMVFVVPIMLRTIGSSISPPPFSFSALLACGFFLERYTAMHVQIYSLTNHILWHLINGAIGLVMVTAYFLLEPGLHANAYPVAIIVGYAAVGAWWSSRLSQKSLGIGRIQFEVKTVVGPTVAIVAIIALGLVCPP